MSCTTDQVISDKADEDIYQIILSVFALKLC